MPLQEVVVTDLTADLARFVGRLRDRLEAGAREYGDQSFTRPANALVDEIQHVCGWALILWVRLDRMRARVAQLGEGRTDG